MKQKFPDKHYMSLNLVAKRSHEMARDKGFWDDDADDVCKKLLLIHSEVSEAAEEVRSGDRQSNFTTAEVVAADPVAGVVTIGPAKPEGLGPELADVLIRTLDLMHGLGMNVEQLVEEKMAYNATRGPKHGKLF